MPRRDAVRGLRVHTGAMQSAAPAIFYRNGHAYQSQTVENAQKFVCCSCGDVFNAKTSGQCKKPTTGGSARL